MKSTPLLFVGSIIGAAGLVKALPNYLGVGDNFPVGSPPKNNLEDNRGANKVAGIVTKFMGDQRRVLLTKPAGKEHYEFVRGKNKMGEDNAETANREAFEEARVHGIADKDNKATVSYYRDKYKKTEKLDFRIVKIPKKQKPLPMTENRKNIWVDPNSIEHLVRRPEMMAGYHELEPIITKGAKLKPKKPVKWKMDGAASQAAQVHVVPH